MLFKAIFLDALEKLHLIENTHCVKSVRIRSDSGPFFPAFELNTERYKVSLRFQSEYGKIRTRITWNTDTFHTVSFNKILSYRSATATEFRSRAEDFERDFNVFNNSNHPVQHFHERLRSRVSDLRHYQNGKFSFLILVLAGLA